MRLTLSRLFVSLWLLRVLCLYYPTIACSVLAIYYIPIPCVCVMRKQWIGTIHGLRCSKYGSILCAGNPWIAQHLRDPWIAQPTHTCQPLVQKKKKGTKVISRERKEIVGEPVLDEVSWISLIRLDLPILSVQLLD